MNRFADLGGGGRWAWAGALLVTNLLFGASHVDQGLPGMISNTIYGLVWSGLYLLAGRNLWIVILAHGVDDSLALVLMYLGCYPGL